MQLPRYSRHWELDRVSYRGLEEATRQLRLTARNDLLHIDAFPTRPSNGWRILRVFLNVNFTLGLQGPNRAPVSPGLERAMTVPRRGGKALPMPRVRSSTRRALVARASHGAPRASNFSTGFATLTC